MENTESGNQEPNSLYNSWFFILLFSSILGLVIKIKFFDNRSPKSRSFSVKRNKSTAKSESKHNKRKEAGNIQSKQKSYSQKPEISPDNPRQLPFSSNVQDNYAPFNSKLENRAEKEQNDEKHQEKKSTERKAHTKQNILKTKPSGSNFAYRERLPLSEDREICLTSNKLKCQPDYIRKSSQEVLEEIDIDLLDRYCLSCARLITKLDKTEFKRSISEPKSSNEKTNSDTDYSKSDVGHDTAKKDFNATKIMRESSCSLCGQMHSSELEFFAQKRAEFFPSFFAQTMQDIKLDEPEETDWDLWTRTQKHNPENTAQSNCFPQVFTTFDSQDLSFSSPRSKCRTNDTKTNNLGDNSSCFYKSSILRHPITEIDRPLHKKYSYNEPETTNISMFCICKFHGFRMNVVARKNCSLKGKYAPLPRVKYG